MQSFLAKVWAFYTKHTLVRHAVTALSAVVIVESAPFLTEWAELMFSAPTVEATAVAVIGAAVRWAQIKLEALVANLVQRGPAPESPS